MYGREKVSLHPDTPSQFPFIYHGVSYSMTHIRSPQTNCYGRAGRFGRKYHWQHYHPDSIDTKLSRSEKDFFSCSDVASRLITAILLWKSRTYDSLQIKLLAIFRYTNQKQERPTQAAPVLFNLNVPYENEKLVDIPRVVRIANNTRITHITRIVGITHVFLNSLHFGQNQYDCFVFLLYTLFNGWPHCGQSLMTGFCLWSA